jgi:prepilin-type N-terminal cleavage/methylation domain-containing protein
MHSRRRYTFRIVRDMKCRRPPGGYTLVEVIIALMVFTTGALALAAGSAVVVREMHASRVRAEAGRLIASRLEIVQSTCPFARSGSETLGPIKSEWTVVPLDSNSVRLAGTVSYVVSRGRRAETYSTIVACR